ncbi:MAG TPA: glycosyltransferase family 4 protein [Candidatus Limnocylindria bacterium]|nr:glycosyltransferase family 4 protein [Candidatus Limnocylindria bacterium]
MTRTRLALLTLGDPTRVTGGYLFHRRLADRAHLHGMQIQFISLPDVPLPWAMLSGPIWMRDPALQWADALILDSIAAAPAAPWLAGVRVPILGMLHQPPGGMDAGSVARSVRARLDRWAYRRAALLMVASEWLAEQLAGAGVPRRRLVVVPPGKDPAPAEAATDGGVTFPRPDFRHGRRIAALCVANWLPRKGILDLLEALAGLPDELVTLHLVGDAATGRYASRVRRRLAQPDLVGRVMVHGLIPASAVARMYRGMDAFVLPSFEEPYGTVWGEAMAAGLPVVGWRAGNLPFLADDEREGLLAPVGDVAALGRALERVAVEPDLREAMGQAARARAASRPTWDHTAERFFGVVAQVLDAAPGSPPPPDQRLSPEG